MPKYELREQTKPAFVQNVVKDMQEHFEEYMIPDDPEKQEAFLKKFETEYAGLCSYEYSFSDNLKEMIKDYNQAVRSPEGLAQDVMKKMYGNLSRLNYQINLEFQDRGWGTDRQFPPEERSPEHFKKYANRIWTFVTGHMRRQDESIGVFTPIAYKGGFFDKFDFDAAYQPYVNVKKEAEQKENGDAEAAKKEAEEAEAAKKREEEEEAARQKAEAEKAEAEKAEKERIAQERSERIYASHTPKEYENEMNEMLSRIVLQDSFSRGVNVLNKHPRFRYAFPQLLNFYFRTLHEGNFVDDRDRDTCFRLLGSNVIGHLGLDDGKTWEEQFPVEDRTPDNFQKKIMEMWDFLKVLQAETDRRQESMQRYIAMSGEIYLEDIMPLYQTFMEKRKLAAEEAAKEPEKAPEEPKAEAPAEEPKVQADAPQQEQVVEGQQVPQEPAPQDVAPEEPKAEVPVEEPKAEVPVEEPKAEAPAEEPKAEVPAPEPVVEAQPEPEPAPQPEPVPVPQPEPAPQVEAPVQAPQDVLTDALEAFQVASNAGIWGRGGHPTEFGNVRTAAAAYKQADAQNRNRAAQELYRACRVYMDRHTDNGAAQYDIGGQLSIGGRLRKQAIVQILQIMTENPDNPAFANLDADYRNACQAENREPMALNIATLEASLATHSKAKMPRGVQHSARDKAYAELRTATTVFRERVQREEEAERQRRQRDQEKREREAQRQREREARRNQPKAKR